MIRTVFYVAIAFVAGILYQQFNDNVNCDNRGGEMTKGLCIGASK